MTYCKFIDGRLIYAPKKIIINGATVYNPTGEQLASQGWKPLIIEDEPVCPEGYHLEPTYTEHDNDITQGWTVVQDEPEPPSLEDRMETIEEKQQALEILLGVDE